MATGGGSDGANNSGNKLTCAICLEKHCRPKILPCYHSFCQQCLQDLVGTSSSFPCPSCRKIMILPPGGVSALQTNFYIEKDIDTNSASPSTRLCDMCTDKREATHTCLQCQQRYCLPCKTFYDLIPLYRGHTVIVLEELEQTSSGVRSGSSHTARQRQTQKTCPKHPHQLLLLHCNKCKADICIQCKLTQHEGHPTEDVLDTQDKAKAKLQEMLESVNEELQQTDRLMTAIDDRCSMLHQQRKQVEQDFESRADTLLQWVDQSLADAVASVQSTAENFVTSLEDRKGNLQKRKSRLEAQRDHMIRVVRDGQEEDMVSLVAQLTVSPLDSTDLTQVQNELTKDLPEFRVNHSNTAVNQLQLWAFVGVVEPIEPAPCVQESVTGEGGDSTGTSHDSPSASSCAIIKVKKAPREITISKDCRLCVHAICPISKGRVWIYYRSDSSSRHLRLLDAQGQILVDKENIGEYIITLNIHGDNILLLKTKHSHGLMISSDGQESSVSMGFDANISRIIPGVQCGHHYITCGSTVHYGKVTLSGDQVTYSKKRVVFIEIPKNYELLHVSADERYFAFCTDYDVRVYTKTDWGIPQLLSSYNTEYGVCSACFCKIDERELLLVTVWGDNKVHVVDHKDGGRFVCYLDTGTVDLDGHLRLSTDYEKHVWIECFRKGVVVHLSADCDCEDDLHTE